MSLASFLQAELLNLCTDARRKYPAIKEVSMCTLLVVNFAACRRASFL
jgi:hypothetical protein